MKLRILLTCVLVCALAGAATRSIAAALHRACLNSIIAQQSPSNEPRSGSASSSSSVPLR